MVYRPQDSGSLMCYWHPGQVNTATFHLTCCGMAAVDGDCDSHSEAARENARGCHITDHTASHRERLMLQTRPFSLCPLDQVQDLPHLSNANDSTVFHFADAVTLPKSLTISVPDAWGSGSGKLDVDLHAEHAKLFAAVKQRQVVQASNDPYANEWDRVLGDADENGMDFVPFVLFLRVSPTKDSARTEEFASLLCKPCS